VGGAKGAWVPERYPPPPIGAVIDQVLAALDTGFKALYAHSARPPNPPEYLLHWGEQLILQSNA
jgi:hypothetical protein